MPSPLQPRLALAACGLLAWIWSPSTADAAAPADCPRVEDVRVAPDIATPVEVQVGVGPGATENGIPEPIAQVLGATVDRIQVETGATAIGAAVIVPDVGRWSVTRGAEPHELFSVGNIGMSTTAALVMADVEAGRISLADPLSRWFPRLQGAEHTTIDQLLTHHTGYASFDAFAALHGRLPSERPLRLVRFAVRRSGSACPSHTLAFSNTNYVLLGLLLEDEHEHLLHELMIERVLTPLGLGRSRAMNRAMPPPELLPGRLPSGRVTDSVDYGAPHGAGNLAMTAHDLATYWHALLSGHIASPRQVELMLDGWSRMDPIRPIGLNEDAHLKGMELYYGRGVMLIRPPTGEGWWVGHTGRIRGFSSMVAWSTSLDAVIAVTLQGSSAAPIAFESLHDALNTATLESR